MKTTIDAGWLKAMKWVFQDIDKYINENQYGNHHIIQHLLESANTDVTDTMKEKMHDKFVKFSKRKFCSTVLENVLNNV